MNYELKIPTVQNWSKIEGNSECYIFNHTVYLMSIYTMI
jgi:hypothetical protein